MKVLLITGLYPTVPKPDELADNMALHYYAREWAKGNKVTVLNVHSHNFLTARNFFRGNFPKRFEIDNVEVFNRLVLRLPGGSLVRKPLLKICEALSFDVVIGHMPVGAELAAYIAQRNSKPYCLGLHYTDFKRSGLKAKALNSKYYHLLTGASLLAFRSRLLKEWFASAVPENTGFILIPGGVGTEWLADPPERDFKNFNGGVGRLLSVARLISRKHIDKVITALADSKISEFRYSIVGDGPELQKLQKFALDIVVNAHVIFEGKASAETVRKKMDECDIMVLISKEETFGLVYLEAMARGCIVIGTKGEGIDGVIVHGENGFLCDPDSNALRDLLLIIFRMSPEELQTISASAVQTSKEYTYEKLSANYLDHIQKVVADYGHE